jgi:hypothetical protein
MRRRTLAAILLALLVAATAAAQYGRQRRELRYARIEDFDGAFQFCRVVFNGGSWGVDFPRADENLSIRLSELTKTPVSMDADQNPNHLLVNLLDPIISRCPFVMMTEVGTLYMSEAEARGLRDYLLRGGFLWADDFWGEGAWASFEEELRKALPSGAYPIVDLPMDHPIFHQQTTVRRVPQIPSINFWGGPGGPTSERGRDSEVPHARAILDDHGRIMVFITHNTDIGDSFEREGDDRRYFIQFSVDGYALGINVLLYAMTH